MCTSAEMQENADLIPARTQIVVRVPGEVVVQSLGGFELEDDIVVDEHIDALVADDDSAKHDRNAHLALDDMSTVLQLDPHRGRIDPFHEPESKYAVDFIEGSDDPVGELFLNEWVRVRI